MKQNRQEGRGKGGEREEQRKAVEMGEMDGERD